jgi:PhnB protein
MEIQEFLPMLTVKDAAAAADFYRRALGAEEISRAAAPTGQLVIELAVNGHRFFAVDENASAFNLSPESLGGTSVRLSLLVDDPDALAARIVEAGGREVFPVQDQPYGMRQGRVADPEGHHWLVGRPLQSSR